MDPAALRQLRTQRLLGPATPELRREAASLDDRVRACEGRPQWYGTLRDHPIAQPAHLALRRAAMGLTDDSPMFDAPTERWPRAPRGPAPVVSIIDAREGIELRYRVLRAPLGVPRHEWNPDSKGTTFGAKIDGALVGVVLLDGDRLRQMAVAPEVQGGNVGRALVAALEAEASRRGVGRIWMHARAHVIGFYASLGYEPEGPLFDEVGIPHVLMAKSL